MSAAQVLLVGTVLALVLAYAVLAGTWVGHEPGWYAALPKPRWQPPDVVFGVMWPLNFLALAVAGVGVALSQSRSAAIAFVAVLAVSIALALGWAYAFYVPHRLGIAALSLGAAAVLTVALVALAARAQLWAGLLLIPYAVWLLVATSLAVGYWRSATSPVN